MITMPLPLDTVMEVHAIVTYEECRIRVCSVHL